MCDQLACNARCWGVYHYHSSDPATGYEFAEVVLAAAAQYWALDADRAPLQASIDDPLASLYPLLNCQRIRDTFGIQQLPWRKAIPQLLKTIYAGETS
jgi:dTDP-4-dehydrorhamnose reductase